MIRRAQARPRGSAVAASLLRLHLYVNIQPGTHSISRNRVLDRLLASVLSIHGEKTASSSGNNLFPFVLRQADCAPATVHYVKTRNFRVESSHCHVS